MEKRSPLGNSLFPLLVPVSVFSTLYGKKKKRKGEKEERRRKNKRANSKQFYPRSITTFHQLRRCKFVPRTNEQPCKGNKGRTKREREEKKRKKREKKRHTYRSTKSIINTIVSGPEKKPLCITLYTYIYVYTHPFIYGGDPLVALMLIPKAVQRRGVGPRDCSCGSSCQRLVTVTPD